MATSIPVSQPGYRQSINWGSAVAVGVVGTVVMTILMYIANATGMVHMDLLKMLGAMFVSPGSNPYYLGALIHLMMGIIFGIIYALVFMWASIAPSWKTGLGFGFVHWIVAGIGMGMMPAIRAWNIPAPGAFEAHGGAMAIMGMLVLHLVYGAVVGASYRPKPLS